ncbi:MAG: hypothetical protein ACXVZ2_05825 [Gaiellaceae bacterium]
MAASTSGRATAAHAVHPGLNGRIVLLSTEPGASEYAPSHLYVFNPDAYGYFIQLTSGGSFDGNPAW